MHSRGFREATQEQQASHGHNGRSATGVRLSLFLGPTTQSHTQTSTITGDGKNKFDRNSDKYASSLPKIRPVLVTGRESMGFQGSWKQYKKTAVRFRANLFEVNDDWSGWATINRLTRPSRLSLRRSNLSVDELARMTTSNNGPENSVTGQDISDTTSQQNNKSMLVSGGPLYTNCFHIQDDSIVVAAIPEHDRDQYVQVSLSQVYETFKTPFAFNITGTTTRNKTSSRTKEPFDSREFSPESRHLAGLSKGILGPLLRSRTYTKRPIHQEIKYGTSRKSGATSNLRGRSQQNSVNPKQRYGTKWYCPSNLYDCDSIKENP
ncbi:hypothetical protein CLU79DRAFT_835383 [Phycomyces nitens]|nr:hypothetical protein CLU79DRAFT_841383 [Phycomyces nitens]KAI9022251.1 hypothetical protein CLU79DRAFT_835383 [Phycomyces nitens]